MNHVGTHLIAEFFHCDAERLNSLETIRAGLLAAAEAIDATVVSEAFHQYAPQGVTGVLLIAESHLSIHTWPEHRYAAVDIFTCGETDPAAGMAVLRDALAAESMRVKRIQRGFEPAAVGDATGRGPGPADVVIVDASNGSIDA